MSSSTRPHRKTLSQRLRRFLPPPFRKSRPLVPVVRLNGPIGMGGGLRSGLSLQTVTPLLEEAFEIERAKAVALVINSPGGSAVQSHLIFKLIRRLAEKHDKHVFAFAEDAAASGGYMIACAADEIFADPSSIIGSIGVVSAGFGLDRLIDKIGVERRVYTAGEEKGMLDPFRPERPEDVERLKAAQRQIHAHFIHLVQTSRAGKLEDDPSLFTGAFWGGHDAMKLGLIDGLSDLRTTLRERYGEEVKLKLIEPPKGFSLRRLLAGSPLSESFTKSFAQSALISLEERALWSRYGL